jgi:hypothetical protein
MVRDPLLGPPDLVLLLPLGAAEGGGGGGPGEILGDSGGQDSGSRKISRSVMLVIGIETEIITKMLGKLNTISYNYDYE